MYFGQPYHLSPPSLHYNNSDMEYRFMFKKRHGISFTTM
jgi:hypothetical protein